MLIDDVYAMPGRKSFMREMEYYLSFQASHSPTPLHQLAKFLHTRNFRHSSSQAWSRSSPRRSSSLHHGFSWGSRRSRRRQQTSTTSTSGKRTPERPLGLDLDASVIHEFLRGIDYDINTVAPIARNLELEAECRRLFDMEGTSAEFLKGPLSILTMICTGVHQSYLMHPFEVKVFISMYTTLLVHLDDECDRDRQAMVPELASFVSSMGSAGEYKNPNLAHFWRLVIEETGNHWGSIATGAITASTLGFLVGCLVESRYPHGLRDVPPTAGRFPRYLRLKSGGSEAYAFFCFPSAMFPEHEFLETYLPTIPDLTELTDSINDILSFYKESVAGKEENTYFMNAARMTDQDPVELVRDVCKLQARVAADVCLTLRNRRELQDVAKVYIRGSTMWHLCQKRYRLAELGLYHGTEHCIGKTPYVGHRTPLV